VQQHRLQQAGHLQDETQEERASVS
jgi:hypothetical protein